MGGGLLIIAAILAILVVIAVEVYPLFRAPAAHWLGSHPMVATGAGGTLLPGSLGVDEYREAAFGVTATELRVLSPKTGAGLTTVAIPGLDGAQVVSIGQAGKDRYLLGTSDGRVIPLEMKFDVQFKDGRRTVRADPVFGPPSVVDPSGKHPILRVTSADTKGGPISVAQLGPQELVVQAVVEKKGLIQGGTREETLTPLTVGSSGAVTAMRMDGRGEDLFLGTGSGQIVRYDLRDRAHPARAEIVATSPDGHPITALEFLIGDRTLLVGDEGGRVSSWQVVPPPQGGPARLTRNYEFSRHGAPVVALAASRRDKGFVSGDTQGRRASQLWNVRRNPSRAEDRGPLSAVAHFRAQGRCGIRGRRGGKGWAVAHRQSPSRGHTQDALWQGLVRRVLGNRHSSGSQRAAPMTSRPNSA